MDDSILIVVIGFEDGLENFAHCTRYHALSQQQLPRGGLHRQIFYNKIQIILKYKIYPISVLINKILRCFFLLSSFL